MNVEHKVSFAPGRAPVSILILGAPAPIGDFWLPDTTQDVLQAAAPSGQVWGDAESMAYAQEALDALYPVWGFTVVLPEPVLVAGPDESPDA